MTEVANSYFMLYLGFRQGLVQDCLSCHGKSEDRVLEFFKYFTCFAGSVRSKQKVCGHSEKILPSVNKIFEENSASVKSWHGDPVPSWGQHFTVCSLTQGQHSLCIHISLSCGSHIRQHLSVQTGTPGLTGIRQHFIPCKALPILAKTAIENTVDVTACSVSNHSPWLLYFHNQFATSVVISPQLNQQ